MVILCDPALPSNNCLVRRQGFIREARQGKCGRSPVSIYSFRSRHRFAILVSFGDVLLRSCENKFTHPMCRNKALDIHKGACTDVFNKDLLMRKTRDFVGYIPMEWFPIGRSQNAPKQNKPEETWATNENLSHFMKIPVVVIPIMEYSDPN